ncbi:iron chelate uptake ABC transporter family permease subunit [Streptomyces sp. NPDC096040]|uniref:iron chelate uptake ABC transporter family permease subunit n=1 Tax=Streptomyces sp. NPDC096040 TaxID=3155541 RepID=UPI00332FBC59
MQTVTRNPLAGPDVIGVGHGAAAATVLAPATGAVASPGAMPLAAVGGGPAAAGLVYALAWRHGMQPTRTPHLPLVCSALTGGLVLVTADLVARTLVPPPEIPVGALTSLVGGPCLPYLLGRRKGLRSSPCRSRSGSGRRC